MSSFDFEKPVIFFKFKLSSLMGILQQLLIELLFGHFLSFLLHFFLLDLLVEVLFLQILVVLGPVMVTLILSNDKSDPRTVLGLLERRVLPVVSLLSSLHLSNSFTINIIKLH